MEFLRFLTYSIGGAVISTALLVLVIKFAIEMQRKPTASAANKTGDL
jgi:hypothetical protein